MAIPALALVFGLAFVSCSNDPEVPRTIEGLFDEIKNINVSYIRATGTSTNSFVFYCRQHRVWETDFDTSHVTIPNFTIADVLVLEGAFRATMDIPNAAIAKNIIKKLDSFYTSEYKLDTAPVKGWGNTVADGTPYFTWYSFLLRRYGYSSYGSSAIPTEAPLWIYYYNFNQ